MVVAGGVEGEVAEEFAGGGVDDADLEVVDEHDDGGPVVGSADADVVESAVVAQGHGACVVDSVVADAVFGVGFVLAGGGFGAGGVGDGGGRALGKRSMWSLVVVELDELVESGLEFGEGGGWGLGA